MRPRNSSESGIALVMALLMMLILSVLITGFYYMVTGEQKVAISNRDNGTAFYAAEGGLEQLSAGLAQLFAFTASPTAAQINALSAPTFTPPGVTYPKFTVGCPAVPCAGALPTVVEVLGGTTPLAGLQGLVTKFTLTVVADAASNAEAKLVRQVQEVAVPVFEFGIFSQTDLSFFAGPNFNFGGRVHSNGNLFLAEGNGNTLTLGDKVTAYKNVIRTQLANGWLTSTNYTGTVDAIVTAGGCPGPVATCRPLAPGEGSVTGGPGSAVNPGWHSLSLSTYNANIRNGATGVKVLNLAIALAGAQPIDMIRRDLPGDSAGVAQERFMNKASLRILLSDTAAALPGNGTFDANGYPAVIPLDRTLNASLTQGSSPPASYPAVTGAASIAAGIYGYKIDACHPPIALSPGNALVTTAPISSANKNYWDTDFATPLTTALDPLLLGGFAEIDMQPAAAPGTWIPVTMEIIQQGIEKPYTNTAPYTLGGIPQTGTCVTGGKTYYPILHLEQINTWVCTGNTVNCLPANRVPGSLSPWDYIPLNTYDTREGSKRDTNDLIIYLNGVMNFVELDVANLQRWFACNGITPVVGTCSGTQALGAGPGQPNEIGGYIVYFSDRRGNYKAGPDNLASNPPLVKNETAEYGNEDIINAASLAGTPDGVLEPVNYNGVSPEDVDGNGVLDTYGATPDPNVVVAGALCPYASGCAAPLGNTLPFATVSAPMAAKNGVVFFRRSLRLYHAAIGQLPPWKAANCTYTSASPDGYGGFTVAAENPAYVQGDFNADSSLGGANIFNDEAGRCHVPSAVIADTVTMLSNSWDDTTALNNPTAVGNRNATTTSYRMGAIAGKNISFAQPTWGGAAQDLGTDAGVHNFLRYLENWGGQSYNYRGSLVSFYYSLQATGIYKCCTVVYSPPTRAENFDLDFQNMQTLPPGTPRFTDVNALSFEQALLPSE